MIKNTIRQWEQWLKKNYKIYYNIQAKILKMILMNFFKMMFLRKVKTF